MNEAVFISDLHLHPEEHAIYERFNEFIAWAAINTRSVYILGDLFHVWPGDDSLDAFSRAIADKLRWLVAQQVGVWFMAGNRDFLLGSQYARLAGMQILTEPTVITLGNSNTLLVHGDRYCLHDKAHQRLRRLTRNQRFVNLFLKIPYSLRAKLVYGVRRHSQIHNNKPASYVDVVPEAMLKHMQQHQVYTIIHGHTHKPGLTQHDYQGESYWQYVLSDWDDKPQVVCYDKTSGFYLYQF